MDPAVREGLLIPSHTSHVSQGLGLKGLIAVLLRSRVSKRFRALGMCHALHLYEYYFIFPKDKLPCLLLGPCLVDLKSNSARWNSAGLVQLVTRSGYGLPSFRVFDISELPTSSVTYGFLANQGNTWLGRATYRHEHKNCHQAEVKTKPPVPGNTVNSMTAGDFVSMYSIHSSKI